MFGVLIWLLLFFGGSILPPVTGIMLNTVQESKRTSANSIANLCYNLLGYLPAPSFYGMVSSIVDRPESTIPMGFLLYSTLFSISFLFYGIHLKWQGEESGNQLGETGSSQIRKMVVNDSK